MPIAIFESLMSHTRPGPVGLWVTNGRQLVNLKGGATFMLPGNLFLIAGDGMWEVMREAAVHELRRSSNTAEILIIYGTEQWLTLDE